MLARDEGDDAGGCGCARAFSGLGTMRSTTTAIVIDSPLTRADISMALRSGLDLAGYGDDEMTLEAEQEIEDEVTWLLDLAAEFPVGTILQRDFEDIREPPEKLT
jgi:hypothetical protein